MGRKKAILWNISSSWLSFFTFEELGLGRPAAFLAGLTLIELYIMFIISQPLNTCSLLYFKIDPPPPIQSCLTLSVPDTFGRLKRTSESVDVIRNKRIALSIRRLHPAC